PERIHTLKEFTEKVKRYQREMGEIEFDWEERTDELVRGVLIALKKYVSEGEMKDIAAELPAEIKQFWEQEVI
ncbi:MAG TPA: DUF2267 domain-containing protein, partial [Anseongella sp.]|nr:DUF2267 domain-containing protein [Anseongella sp.]